MSVLEKQFAIKKAQDQSIIDRVVKEEVANEKLRLIKIAQRALRRPITRETGMVDKNGKSVKGMRKPQSIKIDQEKVLAAVRKRLAMPANELESFIAKEKAMKDAQEDYKTFREEENKGLDTDVTLPVPQKERILSVMDDDDINALEDDVDPIELPEDEDGGEKDDADYIVHTAPRDTSLPVDVSDSVREERAEKEEAKDVKAEEPVETHEEEEIVEEDVEVIVLKPRPAHKKKPNKKNKNKGR